MEKYYRLVIDLYKEHYSGQSDLFCAKVSDARKAIASAITSANILGSPVEELEQLLDDLSLLLNNEHTS